MHDAELEVAFFGYPYCPTERREAGVAVSESNHEAAGVVGIVV